MSDGKLPPGTAVSPRKTATMTEPGAGVHPQSPAGGGQPARMANSGPLGGEPPSTLSVTESAAKSAEVGHVVLASSASGNVVGEALYIRIGSIYKLEGFVNGKPVVYIGKADEIKVRIGSDLGKHKWDSLVQDAKTKVSIRKVYGKLNVAASSRGNVRSALDEAQWSQEEKALRETEQQVKEYNENLKPGQAPKTVLNKIRPAPGEKMEIYQQRHSASSEEEWDMIKAPGSSTITFRVFIGLQVMQLILDAFLQERNRKLARYGWAIYVFVEDDGESSFTLESEGSWWGFVMHYRKKYVTGPRAGTKVEITEEEFDALKKEAHALYGDVDFWGDFIPGLLLPELPVVPAPSPYLDPSQWA
jgi:hypothetical protein